jgi:hypothetical protein
MNARLACIVEGHGEVEAVPVLIRRIAIIIDPSMVVDIPNPIRVPRALLVKEGEVERAVALAAAKLGTPGAILMVIDADDDCPATLGTDLLHRAQRTRPDFPIGVVLAKSEYEAWFLASAPSLAGRRGLSPDISAPRNPEEIRGAKGWLTRQMPSGRKYAETTDQAALTACFDMEAAKGAPSFDKCYREVDRLLRSTAQ